MELFLLYRRSLRKRKAMNLVEERLVEGYELAEDKKNRKSLTSVPRQKRSVNALPTCYTRDANREIFPLSPVVRSGITIMCSTLLSMTTTSKRNFDVGSDFRMIHFLRFLPKPNNLLYSDGGQVLMLLGKNCPPLNC